MRLDEPFADVHGYKPVGNEAFDSIEGILAYSNSWLNFFHTPTVPSNVTAQVLILLYLLHHLPVHSDIRFNLITYIGYDHYFGSVSNRVLHLRVLRLEPRPLTFVLSLRLTLCHLLT